MDGRWNINKMDGYNGWDKMGRSGGESISTPQRTRQFILPRFPYICQVQNLGTPTYNIYFYARNNTIHYTSWRWLGSICVFCQG
jgi:hypothetical protein